MMQSSKVIAIAITINLAILAATGQSQTVHANARYIPSPFTQIQQPGDAAQADISELKPRNEADRQIVFEAFFVSLPVEKANELIRSFQSNGVVKGNSALTSHDFPNLTSQPNDGISAWTGTIQKLPVVCGEISAEQFEQLKNVIKGDEQADLFQAPTLTAFENQPGTVVNGSVRPLVVGIDTIVGDFASAHSPVIQCIEEGIILKCQGAVTDTGVQVQAQLTLNQIIEVDSIQIGGTKEEPIVIQSPNCKINQASLAANISPNKYLLVDPNFVVESEVAQREQRTLPNLPNLSYVNQLFNQNFKVDTDKVTRRSLLILRTRVVEPESTK